MGEWVTGKALILIEHGLDGLNGCERICFNPLNQLNPCSIISYFVCQLHTNPPASTLMQVTRL